MKLVPARCFARKWPAERGLPPKTVLLIVVLDDLEAVEAEALHDLRIVDGAGTLTFSVTDCAVQPHLEGWQFEDILTGGGMSGPLRRIVEENDG